MDVASECGGRSRQWFNVFGDEWVKVAQNNTVWRFKLEDMTNWTKRKMIDRLSDFVRIFQHENFREFRVTGVVTGPGR